MKVKVINLRNIKKDIDSVFKFYFPLIEIIIKKKATLGKSRKSFQ